MSDETRCQAYHQFDTDRLGHRVQCARDTTGEDAGHGSHWNPHYDNDGRCWSTFTPEPPSKPNARPPVFERVIERIRHRDRVGAAKYGTSLQAFNGRNPLVDMIEEQLDGAHYGEQALEEWEAMRAVFTAACALVDREGPLVEADRKRDPLCVAVDAARGMTAAEAIEARMRRDER